MSSDGSQHAASTWIAIRRLEDMPLQTAASTKVHSRRRRSGRMIAPMLSDAAPGVVVSLDAAPKLGSTMTPAGQRRRRLPGPLVGGPVALGCAALLLALTAGTMRRAPVARPSLAMLPLTAQSPVSAALGRMKPAYRIIGLRARNPAQHLRIGFSPAAVTVAAGRGRLGLALAAYGYAGALRTVGSIIPRASTNRVSYSHGSLQEWFANGPLGLEQGFDVTARPGPGSGPLTFSLALSGNLSARLQHGSLLLSSGKVALRYGGLVASDARGLALHTWLQLANDRVADPRR